MLEAYIHSLTSMSNSLSMFLIPKRTCTLSDLMWLPVDFSNIVNNFTQYSKSERAGVRSACPLLIPA